MVDVVGVGVAGGMAGGGAATTNDLMMAEVEGRTQATGDAEHIRINDHHRPSHRNNRRSMNTTMRDWCCEFRQCTWWRLLTYVQTQTYLSMHAPEYGKIVSGLCDVFTVSEVELRCVWSDA